MTTKICAFCGQEFIPTNGMQKFCKRPHMMNCVICGKSYLIPDKRLKEKDFSKTCSVECRKLLRQQTNLQKYGVSNAQASDIVKEKTKATNLQKYGTVAPAQNAQILQKIHATNRERYGCDYVQSNRDVRSKTENTMNAKYGVRCPLQNADILAKTKQTNLSRYGKENPMQVDSIKQRFEQRYKAKTGFNQPWCNPAVKSKSHDTLMKNYGVSFPLQSDTIKQRLVRTSLLRYKTANPIQNPEVKAKARQTMIARYGKPHYSSTEEFKRRQLETMQNTFGVDYYPQLASWKAARMKDPSKLSNLMEFDADPVGYISKYYTDKPSLSELANSCGVGTEAISTRLVKHNCQDKVAYVRSTMEREVTNYLQSIVPDIHIIHDDRTIIKPYEIDLYLPDYHIGIECNPTVSHNSTCDFWDPDRAPTPYNYHKKKTDMCETAGVFLFHLFGWEWEHRKDIIKSMLSNLLQITPNKYYARNLMIRDVSKHDAQEFLEVNHRQGKSGSMVRLGLYTNSGELISLMTFSKLRYTIGKNDRDGWELVRFCNKLNTTVCGGASKLFKYFIKQYNPTYIRSYSDRAHTRGNLYRTLGFIAKSVSDPNYVWVDSYSDKAYHRINAQKRHIKKFLNDDNIDLSQTENEIMSSHGYLKVFDSGTVRWEWQSL